MMGGWTTSLPYSPGLSVMGTKDQIHQVHPKDLGLGKRKKGKKEKKTSAPWAAVQSSGRFYGAVPVRRFSAC